MKEGFSIKRIIVAILMVIIIRISSWLLPQLLACCISRNNMVIISMLIMLLFFFIAGCIHVIIFKKIMYYDLFIVTLVPNILISSKYLSNKGMQSLLAVGIATIFIYFIMLTGAFTAARMKKYINK